MVQKLSTRAQVRIQSLREFELKTQRIYGLVEQYATGKTESEQLATSLKRALAQLKRDLLGGGFEQLSQLAGSMEMAAGRRLTQQAKSHILREGVGSIRFQLDLEARTTASEDLREQAMKAEEAQARQQPPPPATA